MENSERIDLFIEEGVSLSKWYGDLSKLNQKIGKLIIAEYVNSKGSRLIEWVPNDVIVETVHCDQDEWSMVSTKKEDPSSATFVESMYKLNIRAVAYFKITIKMNKLIFCDQNDEILAEFSFHCGDVEKTVNALRSIIPTFRRDQFTFKILDVNDSNFELLRKSFYDLKLYPDEDERFDKRFLKDLRENPYETTMTAFSKISNFVFSPKYENRPIEFEDNFKEKSIEDYDIIKTCPKLPPPLEIYRGEPLNSNQWISHQNFNGQILDADNIKKLIFRGGIDAEIRSEVWPYLLGLYPWDATDKDLEEIAKTKRTEYETLKNQWKSMTSTQENNNSIFRERKTLIEKDVIRTDRFEEFFAGDDNPNLVIVKNILLTYVMYNFDVGYAQGMNDCLVPILYLIKDEAISFWCFASFMERVKNNFNKDIDDIMLQIQNLKEIMKVVCPDFLNYLKRKNADNMFFCFRWLLVWFKREFTLSDIMLLWEVLWTDLPCSQFHLLFCLAILLKEKDFIMSQNFEFSSTLKHINDLANRIDVEEILKKAEILYFQLASYKELNNEVRVILGLPIPKFDSNSKTVRSSADAADAGADADGNFENHDSSIEACEYQCQTGIDLFL